MKSAARKALKEVNEDDGTAVIKSVKSNNKFSD